MGILNELFEQRKNKTFQFVDFLIDKNFRIMSLNMDNSRKFNHECIFQNDSINKGQIRVLELMSYEISGAKLYFEGKAFGAAILLIENELKITMQFNNVELYLKLNEIINEEMRTN